MYFGNVIGTTSRTFMRFSIVSLFKSENIFFFIKWLNPVQSVCVCVPAAWPSNHCTNAVHTHGHLVLLFYRSF